MKCGVLILTHNEERHIARCLRSIGPHATRIVVVDSGSTDRTLEIVRAHPVPVLLLHRAFDTFSAQRNFGVAQAFAAGEWVLHLDADERLTPRLARELAALPERPRGPAYNIPSLTFYRGKPIPRASGYPVYQTRLTRAGDFEFVEVGHGQKAPPHLGNIPRLRAPYEHHPFDKGMADWRRRHECYAQREAEAWLADERRYSLAAALCDPIARRQWLKQLSRRVPFAPELVHAYLLFVKGGIREGAAGRAYCRLRLRYERMVRAEVRRQLRRRNK